MQTTCFRKPPNSKVLPHLIERERVPPQMSQAMAAAARVIAVASNSTSTAASSCLLLKTPFALKRACNALSFNNGRRLSKRLFSCNAIFNPQVQIKQEGQPETLDYRVFFEDTSGKKVFSFPFCSCQNLWNLILVLVVVTLFWW